MASRITVVYHALEGKEYVGGESKSSKLEVVALSLKTRRLDLNVTELKETGTL